MASSLFEDGTFVVDIVDEYDRDKELLLTTFPYLAGKDIQKQILPP